MFGTLTNKRIAILGFAFKSNTNDTRESPAISICKDLLEEGCEISIYDPKVTQENIQDAFSQENETIKKEDWSFASSILNAAANADAILILTEWGEFKDLNWNELTKIMRKPSWLFDTRSITNFDDAKSCGINVWRIGT